MSTEIQNMVRVDSRSDLKKYDVMLFIDVWHAKRKAFIKDFGDGEKSYAKLLYWLSVVVC